MVYILFFLGLSRKQHAIFFSPVHIFSKNKFALSGSSKNNLLRVGNTPCLYRYCFTVCRYSFWLLLSFLFKVPVPMYCTVYSTLLSRYQVVCYGIHCNILVVGSLTWTNGKEVRTRRQRMAEATRRSRLHLWPPNSRDSPLRGNDI